MKAEGAPETPGAVCGVSRHAARNVQAAANQQTGTNPNREREEQQCCRQRAVRVEHRYVNKAPGSWPPNLGQPPYGNQARRCLLK